MPLSVLFPPPPLNEKMLDENGKITDPWIKWFNAIYQYISENE